MAYALQRLNSPDLQLKPEQENSLRALYSGKDTFVWLPTGFGKSLCYTALPFLYDSKLGRTASTSVSLTLVISPLVSLITDQVVDLRYTHPQFYVTYACLNVRACANSVYQAFSPRGRPGNEASSQYDASACVALRCGR